VLATFLFDGICGVVEAVFGEVGRTFLSGNKKYFLTNMRVVADRRRNHSCQLSLFESSS
jgi:hypothetical protein